MALIDSWKDKVNDKDVVDANDINSIAQDVIKIENINGIIQGDGKGNFSAASESELLPEVNENDVGKVLTVSESGKWEVQEASSAIPSDTTPMWVSSVAGSAGKSKEYSRADHTHYVMPEWNNRIKVPPYVQTETGILGREGILKGTSNSEIVEFAIPNVDYVDGDDFATLEYGVKNSDANGVYPANAQYKVRNSKNLVAYWEQIRNPVAKINTIVDSGLGNQAGTINGETSSTTSNKQPAIIASTINVPNDFMYKSSNAIELLLYLSDADRINTTNDINVGVEFYVVADGLNFQPTIRWEIANEILIKKPTPGWYSIVMPKKSATSDTAEGYYQSINTARVFAYPKSDSALTIAVGQITQIETSSQEITIEPAKKILYNGDESTARYYSENAIIKLDPPPAGKVGYTFKGWRETQG